MSTETELAKIEYKAIDDIYVARGADASEQAQACLTRLALDLKAGRAVATKDDARSGYRAVYPQIRTKDQTLYAAAVAALGQAMVDRLLQAAIDEAGPAPVQRKLTDGQSPAMKAAPRDAIEAIITGQPLPAAKARRIDAFERAVKGDM